MTNVIKALGNKFSFQVNNKTANKQKLGILSGIFHAKSGDRIATNTALGAAGYGIVDTLTDSVYGEVNKVSARGTNSKFSINSFQEYIQKQGMQVKKMIIQASNQDVFNGMFEVISHTPFAAPEIEYLDLSMFYDRFQNSENKIEIDFEKSGLELNLNFASILLFELEAMREVSITFIF